MEPVAAGAESALRQARRHRNWTLGQVVRAIDERVPNSGVTESLVSAWERGRRRTSLRYRAALCEIYGQPPEVLFAFQDAGRPSLSLVEADEGLALSAEVVCAFEQLQSAMLQVVITAERTLAAVGSRSRDPAYLEAIERALTERPRLVHWRVLIGQPHRQVLKDHLVRLLALRDPADRTHGMQTLHLGMVDDPVREPERFFVASESRAVVMIPSLTTAGALDTGVILLHPVQARGLVEHAKQLYAAAVKIESPAAVQALTILR
jgi:transcriptional regulator with XRE-family HTH domain